MAGNPIVGIPASQDQLTWLARGKELHKESLKVLNDESQKMVTLGSTLLAGYTGALTLLKIVDKIPSDSTLYIILSIPMILWSIAIFWAFKANFPKEYTFDEDSPMAIRRTINTIIKYKHDQLWIGLILFVISLAASAIALLWSLYMIPIK